MSNLLEIFKGVFNARLEWYADEHTTKKYYEACLDSYIEVVKHSLDENIEQYKDISTPEKMESSINFFKGMATMLKLTKGVLKADDDFEIVFRNLTEAVLDILYEIKEEGGLYYYTYKVVVDGDVKYIGMGQGDRKDHCTSGRSHVKELNKDVSEGKKVEVVVVEKDLFRYQARMLESSLIYKHGVDNLYNKVEG